MEHTSNEKIVEALKLLEEAAKEKKDELKSVVSDKYTHLKKVIAETEQRVGKSFSDAKDVSVEAIVHAKDVSIEKARDLARDVDQNVHRNPWPFIGGTALGGFLLGYLLGRDRK